MSKLNTAAALKAVDEWIDALERYPAPGGDWERRKELRDWFIGREPILNMIAAAFSPAWAQDFTPGYKSDWSATRTSAVRLKALLEQAGENAAIFTPAGPRLAAKDLHPWVWDAARHLWADKHYKQAVHQAASAIDRMLQSKLGRSDLSGSKLAGQAFTLEPPAADRPRLRLPDQGEPGGERYKSAHMGAMHFGQGCFEGIRNWAAHAVDQADEQVALEYLAALSVLARWIDASALTTGEAEG